MKLVDLSEVVVPLTKNPEVLPYLFDITQQHGATNERGLSLLVHQTLGKRLDKTYQVSDWEVCNLMHCIPTEHSVIGCADF